LQHQAHLDRNAAFSRTLGWITEAERDRLNETRVAIAGLGGVGGAHLMTLTRLGVGRFSIADFDHFEVTNFNRQVGACTKNLGRPKVEILAQLARDVDPDLDIRVFDAPIEESNVAAFLDGADVFVDGIDLFAMDARRLVFRRCRELGIPAVTACPLGMGVATMTFDPEGMSFEEYFQLEGHGPEDQIVRFLLGLAPTALQRRSLVDADALDIAAQRAPSTPMGIQLASGTVATEVLKLVTGRGAVRYAPYSTHFDAFTGRLKRTRRRGGNRHLLQRLVLRFASRELLRR
jgi:molybdopterin/thiamine biosynthesis adenylyltransferase